MICSHLFHPCLCNCPRYPPQLVHSATHSEALNKNRYKRKLRELQRACADFPLIHKHRNLKCFSMSVCLLCLRGMCLYILIYLLQRRIQMVNYFLTALLYFKPFLLALCWKAYKLGFLCLWVLKHRRDRQMHTETQRYRARDSVTHTHAHVHVHAHTHAHTPTHTYTRAHTAAWRLAAECQLFVLNAQGNTRVRKASSVWRMNFGSLLSSEEHRYTFNSEHVQACLLRNDEYMHGCDAARAGRL